eukprot:93526_1
MHVPSLLCITWFHISFALNEHVDVYSYCDPTPNSDIHQDNGLYYIKPLANGPIIPVICSNGYTMIDPSLDLELQSIPAYLSSWDYSRESLDYIITNLDDTSTWRQWWLPSNSFTKFNVASQCKSCQPSMEPTIANNVVYYTDSNNFCYTSFIAGNPCAQNINEYACNKCDVGTFSTDPDDIYWEKCSALQTSADTPSLHEPQMRVNHHLIYRPVMSMTRESCTCYQLSAHEKPTKYSVHRNQLPSVTIVPKTGSDDVRITSTYIDPSIKFEPDGDANENENGNKKDCNSNVHYLSQKDFLSGTYRIRECGEYIFTEDVQCNFNAPSQSEEQADGFSANTITGERLYWYPTKEQAKGKDAEYPGLYDYEGTYSLGFFAGITIECDDVVINLNGHSFAMHRSFYLQQRFFSLIEMAAKPFFPNQGASTWGLTGVYYAHNVEIKGPGSIGLSSHHGIHGNMVSSGYIHDFDIHSFDVAGIACNGCQYVKIENMNVGPQNKNIPTLGRYTHARAFIPRLMDLNKNYGHEEIEFYGRPRTTVSALCQRMVNQMDMIYNEYIFGTKYDENDAEWRAAKRIFANPSGWMDGGSSYGVVINGGGAAVVGIGTRVRGTNDISMNNVEIFGVYNQAQEKVKFSLQDEGTTRGILFDVTDWISVTDQIEDRSKSQYIGDVYTDVQFAANKFVTSWYFRNSLYIAPQEEEYVFGGNLAANNYPFLTIFPQDKEISGCGTDIQLHSSKGAIGLMINGAQDSVFNDIRIRDIYNWADLGLDICGEYEGPHLTTEDIDIQYGYTGTRAHGMVIDFTTGDYKNIAIENVESFHGEANGLTIYKESYVNLQNIVVRNIRAGTQLDEEQVQTLRLPNLVPRACPIDIHSNTQINYIDGDAKENLAFSTVDGYEVCQMFADDEENNRQYITALLLVFVILMSCCIWYVKCSGSYEEKNRMNEQTPLLQP